MTVLVEAATGRSRRDWRLLWSAGAISSLGDGAFLAALPLLAATMTSDPRLIAGVTAWGTLPWLLAALPMGALADRLDARRALALVQLAQAALIGVLAVLVMLRSGGIVAVYAVAFAVGLAETLAKVSGQRLIPAVVEPADLEKANGRQNAALFANRQFLGQPLGAFLFAYAAGLPFWVDVASFLLSALLVSGLSRSAPAVSTRRALLSDIAAGVRWLASNRLLRTLSLLAGVANLANFLAMATFVLFVRDRLGVSDAAYGVVVALTGVGGVLGSLLSGRIVGRFGGRRTVTTTLFVTPIAMILLGLYARDIVTLTALASITTFSASLWNVAVSSLRQRTVPAELMGRVSSVGLLLAFGTQPLGALLGGLVAGWWGLAAPWLVAGVVRLVAAVASLRPLASWPRALSR
ncbi:MAG: MFS transporter [Hamadaea sp.]|uniref:MFS transporter n=1 Tax=Hamadaea sp. TaxID=2024425 RepID=UPI0017B92DB5|nr:MFS transporter [Hamadaea sp.]NUR72454.1 MFS transporter [Hamadaea sp.]NUT22230.1 MFS transporter [Hamadaea sp.]